MDDIETLPFFEDPNYLDLVAYYGKNPIAMYSGAGVSWSDDPKFGVGLWNDFVRNILLSDKKTGPGVVQDFDEKLLEWKDKPWEMAQWVADKIGLDEFKQHVADLIQSEENFQKKYKLLSGKFLTNARTLNSLVAFCSDLAGGKISKGKKGQWFAVYQRSINYRVHAVVTSNYDPFLEAASSIMFRKPTLKPVAAKGSSVGGLMEIPVFHIHGYIDLPNKFKKQERVKREPFVEPVITTSDYISAWENRNAYNPTMGPQIHILRHYSVLFIGFSFRDWKVNNLLKKLNKDRAKRKDRLYHYAILRQDQIDEKGEAYFKEKLGVKPIPIKDFPQIKDLLSHLYQQGLIQDHQGNTKIQLSYYEGKNKNIKDRGISLSLADYFEELYNCRLSMVQRKNSKAHPYPLRTSVRKNNRNI